MKKYSECVSASEWPKSGWPAWGAKGADGAAPQQCRSEAIGNNSVWEIPEHIRSVEKGCHQNLNSGFAEQPVIKSQGINYGESQDCK